MGDGTAELVDATGDNRPPVYREDGVWIVRASAFGFCSTRLARHAAGMIGADAPKAVKDAWEFGKKAELPIIRQLEAETPWRMLKPGEMRKWGRVDRSGQLVLELSIPNRVTIRCHPDGIVRNEDTGELRVLEVKTRAEASSDVESDRGYRWQFSIEGAVTKLPVLLVVGWKIPGVDEDGNTTSVRMLRPGPLDVREIDAPYRAGEVKSRAIMLARMFDKAEEQGGWEEGCDVKDWPCPFHLLCAKDKGGDAPVVLDVPEGKRKMIAQLASEFMDAKVQQAAAKSEYDRARKALAAELEQGRYRANGMIVNVKVDAIEASVREVKAHKRTTVTVELEEA